MHGVSELEDILTSFDFLAGIIHARDKHRFKKMIYRGSRGNALTVFLDIDLPMEDPASGKFVFKNVFLLFFESGTE